MRTLVRRPVESTIAVLGLVISLAGPMLVLTSSDFVLSDRLWGLPWMMWGVVGSLILLRRPSNAVGRALLLVGASVGTAFVSLWLTAGFAPTSVLAWAEMVSRAIGVIPWLGIVWLFLTFPADSLPGRAERITARIMLAYGLLAAAAFSLDPQPMSETGLPSPLAVDGLSSVTSIITSEPGFLAVIVFMAVAILLLIRRWRRSSGVERAQFRWLFLGGTFLLTVMLLGQLGSDSGGLYLWIPAGMAIPAAVGVAILRYRLFEIDRLISRAVSWGLVTGLLVAVYLGIVFSLRTLLPVEGEFPVAVSTLAVAALFTPLRRRVQGVVDRRFNRSKYDAQNEVDQFTQRLRSEIGVDDLSNVLTSVAMRTVEPSRVSLWMTPDLRR